MADIFIQHADGTVESIPVVPGSAPDKVILTRAPRIPLVLGEEKYANPTFIIVREPSEAVRHRRGFPFLAVDRESKNNFMHIVKAVNYSDAYYANDNAVAGPNPGQPHEDTWPWSD